ncbi:MAG: PAS domain-containing protein [Halosimplex sp.]
MRRLDGEIRVLHVDDDPDFVDVAAAFLEREHDSITVETATSAREGLDRLATEAIDCVISDYKMPEQNGIELLRTVRETHPDLPFILYTGTGSEQIASEAISAGVTDYLQKKSGSDRYAILANRISNAVERRRAKRESRRSDRRFEAVFDDPHILAGVIDLTGTLRRVNRTAMEYVDGEREDVLGTPFWETPWWDDETRSDVERWVQRALQGEYVEYEATHTRPEGCSVLVVGTIRPVTDDAGDVTALVVSAREITERRRREEEICEKSRLLDNIFEQVPLHLYVKDERARFVRVSEHYVNNFDVYPDAEDHIGKTDLEIYHDDLARASYEDDRRVIETGEPILDSEEYDPGAGDWNLTSKVPMFDEDGDVVGLIGATWRITKQKEYERELERQNERLDEFASVVSHDLRNPLTVARGRLELLEGDVDSDHFDVVMRALDRMEELIENLLVLARNGQTVDEVRSIELGDVAENCWRTVETQGATLRANAESVVRADGDRLSQLLENMFRNAVEHGGRDVTVTVGDIENGFFVEDDGPGVPGERRDELFERGFSTAGDGTGFGLAIVEQIVDAHGWEISVASGDAGGARFEVEGVETD